MTPRYDRLRHNLFAFGIDSIAFGIAIEFIDPITVLPAFAARLGATDTIVGLLVTVFYLAWDLPQLFAGNIIARYPNKKPPLVVTAFIGRPIILFFAIYLFLTGAQPLWLSLVLLFAVLAIMFASDAFAALAWFDLLGRAFPPEKRGGYLSIWQGIKTLGVLGVSATTAYLLGESGPGFPYNYAYLFLAGSIGLLISFVALLYIHEPPHTEDEPASTHIAWSVFGRHLAEIWRTDRRLREVNLARILLVLGTMASAFYVLYATQVRELPLEVISLFLAAQTIGALIGSLFLGRIADRFGSLQVIQVASIFVLIAPILALALTFSPAISNVWLQAGLVLIYLAVGIAKNVIILGFMNYVLDITPPGQRTIYMGVSNAISSVGVIGPLVAGWILSVSSYPILFGVAILFSAGALLLALRMPDSRAIANPAVADV